MKAIFTACIAVAISSVAAFGQSQMGSDLVGMNIGDRFGNAIALSDSGQRVIVGARGYAQVHDYNELSGWQLAGVDIVPPTGTEDFMNVVDIANNGETVLVANKREDYNFEQCGAVRVYDWNGEVWQQRGGTIFGEDDNEFYGADAVLTSDGATVVASANWFGWSNNLNLIGQVRRHTWNGSDWVLENGTIDGGDGLERFGTQLDIASDGSRLVVGGVGSGNGAIIRTYDWSGTSWNVSSEEISIPDQIYSDATGLCLSLSGNGQKLVASTTVRTNTYGWTETGWELLNSWNERAWDVSLSWDGSVLAHGRADGASQNGVVRMMVWEDGHWAEMGYHTGDAPENHLGYTVAVSSMGNVYAAGAIGEFGVGSETIEGYVQVYESGVLSVPGCTDAIACNYNPLADTDDGSCEYSSCYVTMGDSLLIGGVCGYQFTDNGGPLNPYGNNYQITTICPDVPGEAISVFFDAFSLQNTDDNPDQLIIYDGIDAQSPILAVGEASNLFGMLIAATEANPSGCLTFQLLPNWPPNEFAPGWSAEIICSAPCPQSTASFSTDANPFSGSNPQLVGCTESPIAFTSDPIEGLAPAEWVWIVDNAAVYSSESSEWSHAFETGGNHTVQHYVVDENGCPSAPSPATTLAISPYPAYEIEVTTPLCVASEGQLFMNDVDFFTNEGGAIFGTEEEMPIPDATGAWFESELVIDQFAEGQVLEDCSDLFAINALMEHSFVGDLTIQIECPDGTQVMVMENNNSGTDNCNGANDLNGYFLGEPDDFDGTTPNPGVGYWYSFTQDGEYVLDDAGNPNVSGNTILAGEYGLCGDICDFTGCPLNGVWTFQVIDQWGADNGYLFEWNLEFNPSITADYTDFPPIAVEDDASGWNAGSNVSNVTWTSGDGDSLLFEFAQPGSYDFTYEMTNNFGCSFDTTVVIDVVPNDVAAIDAGDDVLFCSDTLQLEVNFMESNQANCSSDAGTYSHCYDVNAYDVFTYCPDEPGDGTMMSITFQSGTIEQFWDAVVVYDGDSDAAPVLATQDGDLSGLAFTATNPDGCLTLVFTSDGWGGCSSGTEEEAVWCVSCGGPTPCAFDWQWEPAEAFVDAQVQNPLLHSALQDSMMIVVTATPHANDVCSAQDTLWVIQNSDCFGCTDPEACNFVGLEVTEDGSCTYPGCTDASACNYDPLAGCDDLSCLYDIGESAFCDNFGWDVDTVFQLPMVPVLLELPLSIPLANEQFIAGFELAFNQPSQFTLDSLPAGTYRIQASGTWCSGNCSGTATSDAAFYFDPTGSVEPFALDVNAFTVNSYCPQGVDTCALLRPEPDVYQADHVYDYFIDHPGGAMDIYGLADECCWWDNIGGLAFEVYFVNDLCSPQVLWSTGETTESISFVSDSSEWVWVELTGGGWSCSDSIWFETSDYIAGCTDSAACNYDPAADMDNGSCYYEPCTFCSDESACNYNPGTSTLVTETWEFDGATMQFFQVPDGVYSLNVTVAGARGGGANAGNGSIVQGDLAVAPGEVLGLSIGGSGGIPTGGFNGGADGGSADGEANSGGGGGGATDIRVAPFGFEQRIVVAAGGGGQGGGNTDSDAGFGGCEAGGDGDSPFGQGGGGATQTAGGTGGAPWIAQGAAGLPGTFGAGGAGGVDPCYNVGPGGGGGGGYFGGGGGGTDCFASGTLGGGGGGGGSSYYPAGMSCSGDASSADGYLIIAYALPLEESCDYSCQCTGDLNGDGFVNVSDILILLGGFGCEAPPACDSDANGDGYTNVADLLVVLGAFGTECE